MNCPMFALLAMMLLQYFISLLDTQVTFFDLSH